MKIVFFCTYYPHYLDFFYKKNPELVSAPYETQMSAIRKDYFGVYTSYIEYFNKMNVDAKLFIPNCRPLQKAWARENNFKFREKDWLFSIPLEQVKKERPDIFYTSSMFEYYGSFLDEIRKYTRNIFGWISCEIPRGVNLNQIDLLFSSLHYYVDKFRSAGVKSEFISHAFNPSILNKIDKIPAKDIEFSFVGNFTRAHSKRIDLITQLLNHTNLKIFGTGLNLIPDERPLLKRIFSRNIYHGKVSDSVWGVEMYRTLQRSCITFNAHIDISKEFIGNMRMYEATGIGTLLLTDGKNGSHKIFEEDEVVYYDSAQDAIDKVNYYIHHENERNAIAKKGQQRTLSEYNYEKTVKLMYDYFLKYMK